MDFRKQLNPKLIFVIVLLLSGSTVYFMWYLKVNEIKPVPRQKDFSYMSRQDWQSIHEKQMCMDSSQIYDFVFLGDSIAFNWFNSDAWKSNFNQFKCINLAIAGDTVQNLLWRVNQKVVDRLSLKAVILIIGTNNLSGGKYSLGQIANGVEKIISELLLEDPKMVVFLLSVLPRGNPASKFQKQAKKLNQNYQSIADRHNVCFIDCYEDLLEKDGNISSEIMPDYLHPSNAGFVRLTDCVKPFLKKME